MYCVISIFLFFPLVNAETLERHLVLDPDGKYHIWWSINEDNITFEVQVETKGWVGFGISPNGDMAGSDIVIGWVVNGMSGFHDRHATGRLMPVIDEYQDWELLWCCENDTHTTFRFRRPLFICKDENLDIVLDETTKLIYAYNPNDPSSATTIGYHGPSRRGSKSVYLLQKRIKRDVLEEKNSFNWEVTMPNVVIPHTKDTTYYCTVFKRPQLNEVNHIIKAEAVLKPGNEQFVHHMILHECAGAKDETMRYYLDKDVHECYTEDQSPIFLNCLTVIYGWAVGGEVLFLPEHTGMPFGLSDAVWFVLEVHYNNPSLAKGVIDNSGIKITYTPKLRPYDSAVLMIGNFWNPCVFVPPKQEDFVIPGHVDQACLRQRIPPEGIKVFATLLHSHIIGRKIKIRHFRGDEELHPLGMDNNYDFNYQTFKLLDEEVSVLPDDHLILECTYDSTKRKKTTFGGLSTREEMCVALVMYYPKIRLSLALSCPYPINVVGTLGVTRVSDNDRFVISPITGQNESYIDFLDSYPWDEKAIRSVQNAIMNSPHLNLCTDRGGKPFLVSTSSEYPEVRKTYHKRDVCSSRRGSPDPTTGRPEVRTTHPITQKPITERPPKPEIRTIYPITQKPITARPQPETRPLPQPPKRRRIPQTMPYELIEVAIKSLG